MADTQQYDVIPEENNGSFSGIGRVSTFGKMVELRENPSHLISLCIVIVLQTQIVHSNISDYTTICSATDPKLNDCFKQSATKMLSSLANGIPALGIPPIDPFQMSKAYIEQPDIGVMLSITNTTVYNLGKTLITNVSAEPEKFRFQINMSTKKEVITGNYKIKGKIFIMPIHGNGRINVTLLDVNKILQFSGTPETRNGNLYMKLTNVSVSLDPMSAKLHLDNLFNGNTMLGSIMNNVLNNSWQDIFTHLKPKLESLYENEVFFVLSEFLSLIPYNQLFRDLRV